jgi:luciferase family oxidoreductase group 1
MTLALSVLDFCEVLEGEAPGDALFATTELAQQAEAWGFARYWLAEHHEPGVAQASPEVLSAVLAGMTERIRVGPAGVLLGFYSPYKVAETFRMLHTLFPGRIDLGIARGGTDPRTAEALLDGRPPVTPEAWTARIVELIARVRSRGPTPVPATLGAPEVWVLGAGGSTASLAAAQGACFSHSLFHKNSQPDPQVLARYRSEFRPSAELAEPRFNLAVAGVCADSEAEAKRLAAAHANGFVVPTVVGSPDQVREALEALGQRFGAEEVVFVDRCRRREDRVRSFELLASAFGLEQAA